LIEGIILLGGMLAFGVFVHHGLSTGVYSDTESIYDKTIVSKAYSTLLPSLTSHRCPRTGRICSLNDHISCKHFSTFDQDKNKIICGYANGKGKGKESAYGLDELAKLDGGILFNGPTVQTKMGEFSKLMHKHKRLIFDKKLIKHTGLKPRVLNKYINTLEKYKFVRTYMDPIHGMTIDWIDDSELITTKHPNFVIKRELGYRKLN